VEYSWRIWGEKEQALVELVEIWSKDNPSGKIFME
jgi:hypothetical protein